MAINLPDFYTDPLFTKGQDKLYGYGSGILAGDVPDFYSVIGRSGSPEFEDMLRMTTRDIQRSALETSAKTGARGGATASVVSKAVADAGTKLRWADLLRSIEGKQFLLGSGLETVGNVTNRALTYGGNMNDFNINRAQLEMSDRTLEEQKKARKQAMWTSILSGTIGGLGTFGGSYLGAGGSLSKLLNLGSASGGSSGMSSGAMDYASSYLR